MLIRQASDIRPSEITQRSVWLRRRELVAALAAVPLARSFELRERAEGLSFLEEEWRAAAASDAKKAGQAFAALIARLYQRPARG